VSGKWSEVEGASGALRFYASGGPREGGAPLLLLCPELPTIEGTRGVVPMPYAAIADRVAQESGWRVVAPMFRGLGGSAGSFSGLGWLQDAATILESEIGARSGLRAAGFGFGAAVALALAASDQRVGGVATFAAPARLGDWAKDPSGLAERCRSAGVVAPGFPSDPEKWAAEIIALEPLVMVQRLEGRPLLVVHGSGDDAVPPAAAQTLVDAGGPGAELRMVLGAGHWLVADPRATATLIGWLERQS